MPTITGTTQYWLEYQNTSYGGTAGTHTPKFTYSTSETDTTFTVSLSSIQATIKLTSCMAQEVGKTYTYKMIDKATVAATGKSSLSYTHTKSYGSSPPTTWPTHTATFANSASFTWNKASSPQSITVSLSIHCDNTNDGNQAAVASVSLTVPALQSWPVTYYSNNGTSASQVQSKYCGVALTLAPTDPIFDGYTLKGWATSSADAAAGTVTWEKGDTYSTNAALDLYAVWELNYSKPAITNLTVERCTSNGTLDDEGQYAKVKFDWSVLRTNTARYYGGSTAPYSSNSVDSCTITVGSKTLSPTLSGASGTVNDVVGDGSFDTDTQYNVSVSITDSQAIEVDHTTTITGIMATTYYPLDFNSDATTMGVFRPAPDNGNGAYFGKDIHVDDDIEADRDITAGRDITATRNVQATKDVSGESITSTLTESSGTYSGGLNDEAVLTTSTINKWKTILGIS